MTPLLAAVLQPPQNDGVSAWAKFVLQIGVPSAIACFLVWVIATQQSARIAAIETMAAQTKVAMDNAEKMMHQFAVDQHDATLRMQIMLRQTCINTAKTPQQVEGCK